MADIAESFQIGFGVGLGMVRNFQETADLMRKREMEKQADALQAQLAKEEAEFTKNATLANAKHESMTRDREAGLPVDEAELKRAEIDLRSMAVDRTKMYARFADRMMASGNPIAVERGQGFLKASMDMASQLQETWNMEREIQAKGQLQDKELEARATEGALSRDFEGQQTERKIGAQAEQAGLDRATELKKAGMMIGSQERIARMEDATRNRGMTQQAFQNEAQNELESRRLDTLDRQTRIDTLSTATEALSKGVPVATINEQLKSFGMSLPDVEIELGNISQETAAQIQELDKQIKAEEADIEAGRGEPKILRILQSRKDKLRKEDKRAYLAKLQLEEHLETAKAEDAAAYKQAVEERRARFKSNVEKVVGAVTGETNY